jgi:hypothetical protein
LRWHSNSWRMYLYFSARGFAAIFPLSALHGNSVFLFSRLSQNCERRLYLRHVRLPVRMEPHWTDLHELWHFSIFRKSSEQIQVSLQIWQQRHMRINNYLGEFFLEWKIFQTKLPEKIKTHILSWWLNPASCNTFVKRPTSAQGSSGFFINTFQIFLPRHVSTYGCHPQGVVSAW